MTTAAPPIERASAVTVKRQHHALAQLELLREALDAASEGIVVLNAHRQIVLVNRRFGELLAQLHCDDCCHGARPGEVLGCVHSSENDTGCGTTRFCDFCGAAQSIIEAQAGTRCVRECRVTRGENGAALDLRVQATPFRFGGEDFVIFALTDIADLKRREALERTFLHDILNTAGVITTLVQMVDMMGIQCLQDPKLQQALQGASAQLVAEIQGQRILMAAERGDLSVRPQPLATREVVEAVVEFYRQHPVVGGRRIVFDGDLVDRSFHSDPTLLKRVLGNMVKNALEASEESDTVIIGCDALPEAVRFWVSNPAVMPEATCMQVFQRSFSTKGTGRGVGTYSMKLLTEQYLHGTVAFRSEEEFGTWFAATYPLTFPSEVD